MHRVTITIDDALMHQLDAFITTRGYANRSEAIRDLARAGLQQDAATAPSEHCAAALVYVYDHHARHMAGRLTNLFHHDHDLSVSTMHVHLDHDRCLEVAVLRGETAKVRDFGEHVMAERGVQYGRLCVIPTDEEAASHHAAD